MGLVKDNLKWYHNDRYIGHIGGTDMNWIKKAKTAVMALVMVTAFGVMAPDAEAYTYNDTHLGITMELAAEPTKSQVSGNAAQMLFDNHLIVVQVAPQQMPKAELDAYLQKSDREVKQQMSAWQKDMGVHLVDVHWVKDGKNPILFAEGRNKQHYMVTASVLSDKTVCTVLRLAGEKISDEDRTAFINAVKTVQFTK